MENTSVINTKKEINKARNSYYFWLAELLFIVFVFISILFASTLTEIDVQQRIYLAIISVLLYFVCRDTNARTEKAKETYKSKKGEK